MESGVPVKVLLCVTIRDIVIDDNKYFSKPIFILIVIFIGS